MVDDTDTDDSEVGQSLMHHWVLAGIVAASARFIPIPFVDDIVRERCRRRIVAKTLMAHGQQNLLPEFQAYYGDNAGCLAGCLSSFAKIPLKLLLFPVRKLIAVATSVRGVPLEVTRCVLLGRTLNRQLAAGKQPEPVDAVLLRTAFDQAFSRMDLRTVRAVIGDALRHVSSWKASAMGSAKELAKGDDIPADDIAATENVQAGAAEVEAALARPEMLALFDEFDKRFDQALERLRTDGKVS